VAITIEPAELAARSPTEAQLFD